MHFLEIVFIRAHQLTVQKAGYVWQQITHKKNCNKELNKHQIHVQSTKSRLTRIKRSIPSTTLMSNS